MGLGRTLFPDPPREFRGRRLLKIGLRAAHVLVVCVLLGAYVFDAAPAERTTWLWAAIASGALILLLDLHESAAFLMEVRGLIVLGKIALVAALPAFGDAQLWVLAFLVVASVLSSHAPASFRHRRVWGHKGIRGAESRG